MNDSLRAGQDEFPEQLLGAIPSALVVRGDVGEVIVWNAGAERLLAAPSPDVLGRTLTEVGFPELDTIADELAAASDGSETLERELLLRSPAGRFVAALVSASRVPTGAGRSVVFVLSDLTHRMVDEQRLRAAHHQSELLLEHSADMLALVNAEGVVSFVNVAITRRAQYVASDLVGRSAFDFVHPDDVDRARAALHLIVDRDDATSLLTFRFRTRSGDYLWLDGRAVNLLREPTVGSILVSLHDVTQRVEIEEQLTHQATHDVLTDLPNRTLFLDRLTQLLEHARRHDQLVAVFFWDVDQFKTVNDRAGHAVGDSLLVEVAERARATMRAEDTVARVGGDEFVACAAVTDQTQVFALAERLREALRIDVTLPGEQRLPVSASIGVSFGSESPPEQMLVQADHAMYDAKRTGGCGISVVSLDHGVSMVACIGRASG